jgi:hypothetical protein
MVMVGQASSLDSDVIAVFEDKGVIYSFVVHLTTVSVIHII